MKKFPLFAALFAVLLMSGPVFALSTEQAPVNTDGSAKFSDPDEQQPAGLVSPNASSNFSAGASVQPYMGSPYAPQTMNMDGGQSAFDHAYNHVANQN